MIAFLVVVVVVAFFMARRRRRSTLAGLNVERPTYSIPPPSRWTTSLKDHRL